MDENIEQEINDTVLEICRFVREELNSNSFSGGTNKVELMKAFASVLETLPLEDVYY